MPSGAAFLPVLLTIALKALDFSRSISIGKDHLPRPFLFSPKELRFIHQRRGKMADSELSIFPGRRRFLLRALPAGTMFCLGCGGLFSRAAAQSAQAPEPPKHKFLEDSGLNFEEGFRFAYKELIETMKFFGRELGKERLLEMLRKDSD